MRNDSDQIIEQQLKNVIRDATNKAADACLPTGSAQDNTVYMSKRGTVFFIDTTVLAAHGNPKLAKQVEQEQQHLLIDRRKANHEFDQALLNVDEIKRNHAVNALNYIKERLYFDTYNLPGFQIHDSPAYTLNSLAESRLSQAKLILAQQLSDGTFADNLYKMANNGMQTPCESKNQDVVR
jgi:hypothetical protein